jgi:glycosyltransferase involved in cell wall biosynthesis
MSTISMLITYYNEREMLTECLESLLANTELPDEILVYDDGSDYPAQDYTPDHPLIRVVRGERNGGFIYARNALLERATSDYLHFHDADDWFMPTWTEAVRRAVASDPDLIITMGDVRYEDGKQEPLPGMATCLDLLCTDFKRFSVEANINFVCLTFRRQLAEKIGGVRTDGIAGSWDYYFGALLAHEAQRAEVLQERLFVVRRRRSSLSLDNQGRHLPRIDIGRLQALMRLSALYPQWASRFADLIAKQAWTVVLPLDEKVAAEGFAFVRRLGRPTYSWIGQPWRAIARTLGPMTAYRLFRIYAHPSLVAARGRLKTFIKGQTP